MIIKSICYKSDKKISPPKKIKLKMQAQKVKATQIKVQFCIEIDKLAVRIIARKNRQRLHYI